MRQTLTILSILAMAAMSAHAGILITFDQPLQVAHPGDLLHFTGVISNSGPGTVFLDSDTITPLSPDFTIIDQFFANVPVSLDSGTDSGPIDLFDVQLGTPPLGLYTGSYVLFQSEAIVGTADFSIQVVPEPSTFLLLGATLVPLAINRVRRRRV
jgi:hypothetical protein